MNNKIKNQTTKSKKEISFVSISVIFIILALLLTAILKTLTPAQNKIISNDFAINNYDGTQTTYKKINYSGPDLIAPETFNIYSAQNSADIARELADKLIISNDLIKNEQIENYWEGEASSLAKINYENSYVFKNATASEGDDELVVILSEAINVCNSFYKKYNLETNLIPQKNDVIYLNSAFEQSIVDADKATFVQIPLTYELDGYQVFYENQSDYPFFCRVDNSYNLERVVFKDFFQRFSLVRNMPSISIDKAVGNIKKENASIIEANSNIITSIDLNWINEADLYSVAIEYRYDSELKIAYPFYRFQANLTNSAGINIEAEIITPAVATAQEK